ncbi:conserved hypothetical protein [Leishmania mexicana MHOM/GT/2001/U1103]|uniref:Uncharacterized protein n=1 Tax=Leishmania mexicana (strain MHOM/GT/2001/U1103) TaxID=929439 RepID=E9ATY2_LEIMU|nr:conserved hypothetical protein [Leishmania mexicana MHOM/GT/2001/U1103]CBZ26407.1 conserved hypothetical protein [Leishmania mexicana MHOM/GT/2001/U1103]
MEFSKRVGELAHLTRRLSRVQTDEARSRRLLASACSAPNVVENEAGLRISASQQRVRSPASVHHHTLSGCAAAQNQLLLRRIPLSVSLVERSWWKLECRQQQREAQRGAAPGTIAGSASSPPASSADVSTPSSAPVLQPEKSKTLSIVQSSPAASRQHLDAVALLLKLLHSVEEARRQVLRRKERTAQRRCAAADDKWRKFQEELAPQLRRRNWKSGKQNDVRSEDSVALLRGTANMLQERCRAAKEDESLLRASLLARSFVSARLWELLLRKTVWTAAVVEHKRAVAATSSESSLTAPQATRLLLMCLAFTRLSLGVLRDYVEGGCFSRHAPRFVVSMPSRSWQSRKRKVDICSLDGDAALRAAAADTSVEAGDGARDSKDRSSVDTAPGSNQEDALFSMLQESLQAPGSAAADVAPAASAPRAHDSASNSTKRKRRPGRVASMRWIPPHTAHVIPLASQTLALHSLVLPEMDVPALLRLGCAAELVDLCVTLQRLASCVLVLSPQQTPSLADSTQAAKSLQHALHCLEDAITMVGRQVKTHLVTEQSVRLSSEPIAVATTPGRLQPADAARLAVQLHRLRLLPVGDADAALLLSQLLRDMFPELRTKTSRILREKARQSSLLAFATRPHRMKLYVQHGRRGAEGYVLGTIVQQARLQQRQLAAALRAQHISEVHVQQLGAFAESLPPNELVRLIQLCASHAHSSHVMQQRALSAEAFDTPVTGCLFLAEALLISGALQTTPDQPSTLSLQELAILWDAATLLYPLIRARRAQQLVGGAGRSRLSHAAKTESVIWATFTEHVLVMVNGALAQRLQSLEKLRQHESTAMRRARVTSGRKAASDVAVAERETALIDSRITADGLVSLAAGVLEYAEHDESVSTRSATARTHSSSLPVQKLVQVLARLLQELVFHDRQLWHSLSILPATQRNAVERQLVMCFQTMGMLDETTTRALDALSRRSHVEL